MQGMKGIYRSARQEAIRKAMISKIWSEARNRGLEKYEIYDLIAAEARRGAIRLYKDNWKVEDGTRRVSLSSLRQWQLRQALEAIFPDLVKPKCNVVQMEPC